MIVGASVAFGWEVGGMVETTQTAPMTAGVACSIITMIVVSLLTQKTSPVPAHIQRVMDEAATVGPIPDALIAASDTALAPEASIIDARLNEENRDD